MSQRKLRSIVVAILVAVPFVVPGLAGAQTRKLRNRGQAQSAAPSGGAAFSLTPALTTAAPTSATSPLQGATTAPTAPSTGQLGVRVLKQGLHGDDVSELQGYLTLAGFPTAVDGDFGKATRASVVAFQNAHSLTANGQVTAAVVSALNTAVAASESTAPVGKARINPDGTATAPAGAPLAVQQMIASANKIIGKPYIYAGGHSRWNDNGYDCSGSVSFALHGAGMLSSPEDSTDLEAYGSAGPGKWITIYADSAHTWVVVAGIAFDTADFGGPNIPSGTGPRWRTNPVGNLADGGSYVIRHPAGF